MFIGYVYKIYINIYMYVYKIYMYVKCYFYKAKNKKPHVLIRYYYLACAYSLLLSD